MRKPLRIVRDWSPFGVTIIGDPHILSPHHNAALFKHDMGVAAENGDSIWLLGDNAELILPRDNKRHTAAHELERDSVINKYVDATVRTLEPYADYIDILMIGNHETAALKYNGADVNSMVIARLNTVKKAGAFRDNAVHHGGYRAYVQVQFKDKSAKGTSTSLKCLLFHGTGGGAPVTKGMIDGNRLKVSNVFDICAIGHKHTDVYDFDTYNYLDDYGNIRKRARQYCVVGGYNNSDMLQDPDVVDEDGDPIGYRLDYPDTLLGSQGEGCVHLKMVPRRSKEKVWVEWTMTKTMQALAP